MECDFLPLFVLLFKWIFFSHFLSTTHILTKWLCASVFIFRIIAIFFRSYLVFFACIFSIFSFALHHQLFMVCLLFNFDFVSHFPWAIWDEPKLRTRVMQNVKTQLLILFICLFIWKEKNCAFFIRSNCKRSNENQTVRKRVKIKSPSTYQMRYWTLEFQYWFACNLFASKMNATRWRFFSIANFPHLYFLSWSFSIIFTVERIHFSFTLGTTRRVLIALDIFLIFINMF